MSLNVIGLISGGKDSLFSLAHCVQQGHRIVALANLYPGSKISTEAADHDGERPDLDSFMYQTVGHSIIPLYADALELPLYRRAIQGTAIQDGRYYASNQMATTGDETEDMYFLLKEILESHPEANALNAGAILSTYQRTRVESVAVRLGLIPLAYLWQYPALPPPSSRLDSLTGLLDDMSVSACDARIIKIASGGIRANMGFANMMDPSVRAKLVSGMTPFFSDAGQEYWLRGAVLGEGGEYETLAIDGPGALWKKRIQIESTETYDGEGGAVYVRLGSALLLERHAMEDSAVPVPSPLDKRFVAIQDQLLDRQAHTTSSIANVATNPQSPLMFGNHLDVRSNFIKSSNNVHIFNLTGPGATAAEELETIIATLPLVLQTVAHSYDLSETCLDSENIVNTILLLRSMEDFASVNEIYTAKLWPQGLPNPPARVTIATPLPREARVSISLVYDIHSDGAQARKGLHVQSRSYWAPANIGPYSQAISVPMLRPTIVHHTHSTTLEIVYLAGQIPLIPESMSLSNGSFVEQAALALQHLWRVAQERGCDAWTGAGVAFLADDDNDHGEVETGKPNVFQRVHLAAEIWKSSHLVDEKGIHTGQKYPSDLEEDDVDDSNEEGFDVWNLQQMSRGFGSTTSMTVGEHLHKLPNRNILVREASRSNVNELRTLPLPPLIVAEVTGLPRNASIEWWATGIAGLMSMGGSQHNRVFSLPPVLRESWSLSVTATEDKSEGADDDSEKKERARDTTQVRAMSFFAVLSINSSADYSDEHTLPRTLEDLTPHLGECIVTTKSLRYEVVTAQSFVNLSCRNIEKVHSENQLLQDSSIIPCNHVWYQQSTPIESFDHDAERGMITEVAVAVVMRIETSLS